MATPPQATSLSVEGFAGVGAEERKLVEKLAFILNPFFNDIVANLDSSLTFADNFLGQVKTLSFTMPSDMVGVTSFTNGWLAGNPVSYSKDAFGYVDLEGVLTTGAIASSAFTLPEGFRPPQTCSFSVVTAGALTPASVDVLATGLVVPAVGSNVFMSLSGIRFRASDRRPPNLAAPFPMTIRLDRDFPGTPGQALVLSAIDVDSKAPVAGVSLAVSPSQVDGAPAISIRDVKGCSPGRSYELTVLVLPR